MLSKYRSLPQNLIGAIIFTGILWQVLGFMNLQVFSSLDAPFEYGHLGIPGSAVVHLPQGRVKLFVEDAPDGAVNHPDDVTVTVEDTPSGDRVAVVPAVDKAFEQGGGGGIQSSGSPLFQRIAVLDVPLAGDYRISTTTRGVAARLDLGQERPLTNIRVILIVLGVDVVAVCGLLLWRRRKGKAAKKAGSAADG